MNTSINSINPVNLINLRFFSYPAILEAIGHARLAKFFDGFDADLRATSVLLPDPETANGSYCASLAAVLSSPELLPERLRGTLLTLERLAAPENLNHLQAAFARYFPDVRPPQTSPPIDRALDLWFWSPKIIHDLAASCPEAPPNLSAPARHSSESDGGSAGEAGEALPAPINPGNLTNPVNTPAIQNLNSKIENEDEPPAALPASVPPDWVMHVKPWPEPVDAKALLDTLRSTLLRFLILPKWVAETLALWILHTYAFEWRDVSTYLGVESPERRCGKTTLLTILCRLVNRPVVSANVSSPAFFRAIEELKPTLMIDEADRFLKSKSGLQGILNAGYHKPTAYVLRMVPSGAGSKADGKSSDLAFFSCWCPKVIAQIGRLPETLADRCIVFRMQRKTPGEECERIRNLETITLRRQCARFVLDHGKQISNARPELPKSLNDRAADIWEPLFVLADLAGGEWPELARRAAVSLSASAEDGNSIGSLLLDIFVLFIDAKTDRMFTRTLVEGLNSRSSGRPWMELRNGQVITESWLAQQLRPYGIRPRTFRIAGSQAKGYLEEDCMETFRRYIPKSELEALLAESEPAADAPTEDGQKGASDPNA